MQGTKAGRSLAPFPIGPACGGGLHGPKLLVRRLIPGSTSGSIALVRDLQLDLGRVCQVNSPTGPASRPQEVCHIRTGPPHYLRSKRSMSFHATRSETFSGYTFFDVSQS